MSNYAGSLKFDTKVDEKGFNKGLASITSAVKGVALGYGGKKLVDYLIGSNAEMEQYLTSFEVMLGSASKATKLMNEIVDFAGHTPLQLTDVTKASQMLMNYGVGADDVIGKLQQLGDLSMGNAEKLDRVTLAYGQMLAKGKVSGEELRQMTEAGVPLLQALADNIGVSTAELQDMISAGEVGIPELNGAISDLTAGTGKFAGMMEKQSQTMNGMISTLKDQFIQFGRDTGEKAFGQVKDTLEELMDAIDQASKDGTLEDIAEDVGNAINTIVKGLINVIEFVWEYKEAIMAGVSAMIAFNIAMKGYTAVITVINAYKKLKVALETATLSQLALNTAMKANPIGLVIAGIVALTSAIGVFSFTTGKANDVVGNYNEAMEQAKKNSEDTISNTEAEIAIIKLKADTYEKLRKKYEETGEGLDELQAVAEDLTSVLPEQTRLIDEQTGAYLALGGAIDDVITKMRSEAYANAVQSEYETAISEGRKLQKEYDELNEKLDKDADSLSPIAYFRWDKNNNKLSNVIEKQKENDELIAELEEEVADSYIPSNNSYTTQRDDGSSGMPSELYNQEIAKRKNAENAKQSQDQQLEDFKTFADDLKQQRNVNLISDQEYYSKLKTALEDGNHDKLGEYNEYWAEVISGQERLNSSIVSSQKSSNDKFTEMQKKSFDEWSSDVNALADEYSNAFNEIATKRANLQNKLASFGGLFSRETVDNETKVVLTDLDEVTDQLKEYQRNLKRLKGYGASSAFMNEVTAMGVEDGLEFTKALLSQSQYSVGGYLSDWENNQKVAEEIANEYYQQEIDNLQTEYVDKFNAVLSTMPENAKSVGTDTLQGFIDGLSSKADTVNGESENLMQDVITVCKEALDIHSPSRVFKDIGENTAEGFIEGLEGKADDIYSRLKEVFGSSITKVFEELQMQVNSENARLAQTIASSSPTFVSDKGTNSGSTFVQNNYSPKALTPYEVGRQTRQMFQLANNRR